MKLKAQEVADLVGGIVDGNKKSTITKLSKIENGDNKSLSFLGNPKYNEYIYKSKASIIIVDKRFELKQPITSTLIRVDDPKIAFSLLLDHFNGQNLSKNGIDPSSSLDSSAKYGSNLYLGNFSIVEKDVKIGENVKIYPQVYLGENVEIGDNCIIYPGVKIYRNTKVGKNCIIHSSSVIGSDGFGFNFDSKGNTLKVIHNGNVIIEDDVEIGANCTIDRATLGSTLIKSGAKLDNLVQIAHNVIIGKNTCLAAQVGVAGSTTIGDNCLIGGQAGIAGHLKIGNNVRIQGQTGVLRDIPDNKQIQGTPAIEFNDYYRSYAYFKKLPDFENRLKKIEKK